MKRSAALVAALLGAGCGDRQTLNPPDSGDPDGDLAADAEPIVDARPSAERGGGGDAPIGAVCAMPGDCASGLCGPGGRCATLRVEVLDAQVGTATAAPGPRRPRAGWGSA
jgi:hypothetical protein